LFVEFVKGLGITLKQVFRNGGIVLLFPRLGGESLESFRAVLRQIPAQRPFRQTRLLHDLLTDLPLLRGIQPLLEKRCQGLDTLGGDFRSLTSVFHAKILLRGGF